jgi:hypothetical protein
VRKGLQEIFGTVCHVKLDSFHWFQRWDNVLYDINSEEAAIFRGLMRRAVKVCDDEEYARAKEVARAKLSKRLGEGAVPTHRQIMLEARVVIPPKEELEKNVLAVLSYCYSNDAALELRKMQGDSNSDLTKYPTPFFKSMTHKVLGRKTVRDAILNQMDHIKKDCLSDVPGINLYQMNADDNKVYCCRGTSSNETDNFFINCITGSSVGIGRCDRLLSTFFEVSIERKRCYRMGESKRNDLFFTHRTERLGMINSFTRSSGWTDDELPFLLPQPADVTSDDIGKADIGFDSNLSLEGVGTVGDILMQQNTALQEDASFVEDDNGEPESLEDVPLDDNVGGSEVDVLIESKLQVILPLIRNRETTMDAFKRLTNQAPWIPFNVGGKDDVDLEEATLFDEMHVHYNRKSAPRSNRGYFSFMKAWNIEVTNRYRHHVEGNIGVVLINRKSVNQLQDYYDKTEGKLSSSLRVENGNNDVTNSELEVLNGVIRETRRNLTPLPAMEHAQLTEYPQQGCAPVGCPTVLNPSIVVGALQNRGDDQRNPAPWIVRPALPTQPINTSTNSFDGFQSRTWCVSCGWRKVQHLKQERFGKPCLKDLCGKCYQRGEFHPMNDKGDRLKGPFCPFPPHPQYCQQRFWYTS